MYDSVLVLVVFLIFPDVAAVIKCRSLTQHLRAKCVINTQGVY